MTPVLNISHASTSTPSSGMNSPIPLFMMDTTSQKSIVSILQRIPVFGNVEPAHLIRMAEIMDLVHIDQGTTLVQVGDVVNSFIIVVQGELVVTPTEGDSFKLTPYDFIGFKYLFNNQVPAPCSIQVTSSGLVLELKQARFQHLLQNQPSIALALLPVLAHHAPDNIKNGGSEMVGSNSMPQTAESSWPEDKTEIRVKLFDAKPYQTKEFINQNQKLGLNFKLEFYEEQLSMDTIHLARGAHAVCVFVHDNLNSQVVAELKKLDIHLVLYRCAGYELCDVAACDENGISVCRVPGYSPNAIAEHAVALMMALNRKLIWANSRVHNADFSLDGLVGFDMKNKTVGVIGTGRIGVCTVSILLGFGCRVLCYDVFQNPSLSGNPNVQYTDLDTLFKESDIISLHAPLMPETYHVINAGSIELMKRGVMIINTSRGPLIDTQALIDGLKSGHVGSCGLDVVEGEQDYFYKNCSDQIITNDQISHLLSFHIRVIITAHQAFLTNEALSEIASISLNNVLEYHQGNRMKQLTNSVNKARL